MAEDKSVSIDRVLVLLASLPWIVLVVFVLVAAFGQAFAQRFPALYSLGSQSAIPMAWAYAIVACFGIICRGVFARWTWRSLFALLLAAWFAWAPLVYLLAGYPTALLYPSFYAPALELGWGWAVRAMRR